MTPSSLPRVKWTIRSFTMQRARGLADMALKIDNESDIQQLMNRALKAVGFGVFVREA
jgi:phosphotransferase system enzyme I (PtsP)